MRCRFLAAVVAIALTQAMVFGRKPENPIVRQVDHILFTTIDDGRGLVSLLAERLALPVVWPQPGEDWTASTGIGFGNVNLEVFHRAPALPSETPRVARITSLALQPTELTGALKELHARGIDHVTPDPVVPSAGTSLPRWTAVPLRGFGHRLFLLQYVFDMDERRSRFDRVMRARNGGPLGVQRVREVIIAVSQLDQVRAQWMKLLGPTASAGSDVWAVGQGPQIRLVKVGDPSAGTIVVEVNSLSRAADALRRLGIRTEPAARQLRIDPDRIFGLRLVLWEENHSPQARRRANHALHPTAAVSGADAPAGERER